MAKINTTDLVCKSTIYLTPSSILDPVRQYFGGVIPLDPATEPSNPTKATWFGTKKGSNSAQDLGNGLAVQWSLYDGTFINPPYGKEIRLFCRRICEEAALGAEIIALLPAGARFSTRYFQDYIFNPHLEAAAFIRGRVKFLRPDGTVAGQNPYDSVLYGFNVDVDKFTQCFAPLGKVMMITVL